MILLKKQAPKTVFRTQQCRIISFSSLFIRKNMNKPVSGTTGISYTNFCSASTARVSQLHLKYSTRQLHAARIPYADGPSASRRSQNCGHRDVTNGYKCVLINCTALWIGLVCFTAFAFSHSLVSLISLFIWNEMRRRSGDPDRCYRGMNSMLMPMFFWKGCCFLSFNFIST